MAETEVPLVNKPIVLCFKSYQHDPEFGMIKEHVKLLEEYFKIIWQPDVMENEQVLANVEGVVPMQGLMPHLSKYLKNNSIPKLKIAANFGVGVDHIPVKEFKSKGVYVSNTPHVLSAACAELAISLLLASSRRLFTGFKTAMGANEITKFSPGFLGHDVYGTTLGIVGLGSIGREVAQRAAAFNMKILYHNRKKLSEDVEKHYKVSYCSTLHQMLPICDYVIISCPLSHESTKLFGENEFSLMKLEATIINIARGEIIDQDALVEALRNNKIRAAALDVTHPEPLPRNHPLLQMDNVIISPHLGSATVETRMKMMSCVVENLKCVLLQGKDPPNEL